jgi:hypothetical protein
MSTSSKAGTGSGSILVINATPATLATPASIPSIAFSVAPATTPTGITILQMKSFTMPSQKVAFDDITNTNWPFVGVLTQKESIATTVDPGEMSITGIFVPSDPGLIALQTAFSSGLEQAFQVQLKPIAGQSTTGNVYSFLAFISENPVPSDVTPDKAVTIKISLKLNSMLTVIEGS